MIVVEPFMSGDWRLVQKWLLNRGMNDRGATQLPSIGMLAFYDSEPVCAGFIRKIEGGFGLLDSLITNPAARPEIRNDAIDAVVIRLIEAAKTEGIYQLLAHSTDAHTLERSKKHGFLKLPDTLIALAL